MFSVISDLFLKAESNITNASKALENEKNNLNDIKKYSGDFKKDVNSLVDDISSVKKDIKDLLVVVNKAKASVSDLNSNSNSTSGYSAEELEGMTLGSSVVGLNQNLELQISSLANLSESEYFALIDNCAFLSEADKELAKRLFQEGNLRASFVVFLRSDCINQINKKKEELANKRKELTDTLVNDPDYPLYEHYCNNVLMSEDHPEYEYFQELKAKFENYDNNEEIKKLEQEIVALEQQKYRYEVAIKEWSFDYLDKNENYLNYTVTSSSITSLLASCKDYYGRVGTLTEQDFLDICQSQGIDPDGVNKILFYQELQNSGWYGESDDFFDNWGLRTDVNTIGSLEARALTYLTDEELKKYHYLYETEGKEKASEYLLAKEDSINNLQGIEQAIETIKAIESGNYSATRIGKAFLEGTEGGVTNWLNNTLTVFNGNTTMTSQEYEDMYVAQMLMGVLSSQLISESDLDILYKKGEIDDKVYNNLVDKGGNITNYDLMYAKGDITESEYLGFKQLSTNQEYQNLVSKISNSNILGIDINEGSWLSTFYSAGNSTGYMVPSVLMSLMGSGVSPTVGRFLASGSMGLSSYGGSYKEAIRTGANDLNATIFALLSAGSEVGLEIALGGIKGIAKGEDFIDLGVDVSKMNSYLNVIGNSITSYGGSITSEIKEELIQLALGKVLEGTVLNRPIDFSGIEGEALQTILCTVITTSALNLPSNVLNFGVQSYEYHNYLNSVQLSIDLGNGNIVEYTGKQLKGFVDDNGNIDQNKVMIDVEYQLNFSEKPPIEIIQDEKTLEENNLNSSISEKLLSMLSSDLSGLNVLNALKIFDFQEANNALEDKDNLEDAISVQEQKIQDIEVSYGKDNSYTLSEKNLLEAMKSELALATEKFIKTYNALKVNIEEKMKTIEEFQPNSGGFEPIEFIDDVNAPKTSNLTALPNPQVQEMLAKYKTFSKDKQEAIQQLAEYFGDIGSEINDLFKRNLTIAEIRNNLSDKSKKLFDDFLATTRHGQYISKLTTDELYEINDFTVYSTINDYLRKEIILEKDMHKIHSLDSAISKFGGVQEPTVFYRGIDIGAFAKQSQSYQELFDGIGYSDIEKIYGTLKTLIGEEFSDLGYMSSTPCYNMAIDRPMVNIVLEIMADSGTQGAYINQLSSFYNQENEFVFARGTILEMLDVYESQGKIVVTCKVKNDIRYKDFMQTRMNSY